MPYSTNTTIHAGTRPSIFLPLLPIPKNFKKYSAAIPILLVIGPKGTDYMLDPLSLVYPYLAKSEVKAHA